MGSLAYMRMLANTVDAMADGARGVMKYVFPFKLLSVNYIEMTHSLTHLASFVGFTGNDLIEVQLTSHGY